VIASLALSLCSCGSSAGVPLSDAGAATDDAGFALVPLALGTGESAWQDIPASGGHVRLIMGPQGGYHTLGRVRFSGLCPDVSMRFTVTDVASGTVYNDPTDTLRRRERQGLVRSGDGWESSAAELVIFTQVRDPATVAGRRVRWDVVLEEPSTGRRARASREFIVDYP
jgi:hypothetical protein